MVGGTPSASGRRGRGSPSNAPTGNRRGVSWVYPDRKRCYACRRYFGFEILSGLYCSTGCARVPPISVDPADWPREHFSQAWRGSPRKPKRNWLSMERARIEAKRFGKEAYWCGYCLGAHIGGRYAQEAPSNVPGNSAGVIEKDG